MAAVSTWTFSSVVPYPDPTNPSSTVSATAVQEFSIIDSTTFTAPVPVTLGTTTSTIWVSWNGIMNTESLSSSTALTTTPLPSTNTSSTTPSSEQQPTSSTNEDSSQSPPTDTSSLSASSSPSTSQLDPRPSTLTSISTITVPTTIFTESSIATSTSGVAAVESNDNDTLSDGAITGIGIGAGLGGGILTLLALGVLFLFYRRHPRREKSFRPWTDDTASTTLQPPADMLSVSTEMAPIPTTTRSLPERKASTISHTRAGTTTTNSIGFDLLPPLSDNHLASLLLNLKENIKAHVSRFYTTSVEAASPKPSNTWDSSHQTLVRELGKDAPLDPDTMDTLLQEPQTRMTMIRVLIAWMILRNIEISAPLDRTLLPPELVRVFESIDRSGEEDTDLSLTHSQTRHTSASLLSPLYNTPTLTPSDPRRQNIAELTTLLVTILQPYVLSGFGQARVKDLERVIAQGAQFGFTVFAQPTTWKFDWNVKGRMDEIVVFPGFVKVGDERGGRLRREVVVCRMETMRVGVRT